MCSDWTARSRNESGSEFQTVGLATEKARVSNVLRRNRGIFSFLYGWGRATSCHVSHS